MRVKADYKHKMVVHSTIEKHSHPNFLRLVGFSCLAILLAWVWYQFNSPKPNATDSIDIVETELPDDIIPESAHSPMETLELVALAPVTAMEGFAPLELPSSDMATPKPSSQWASHTISKGKNLSVYLSQHGLDSKAIHQIMSVKHKKRLQTVHPGQELRIESINNAVKSIELKISSTQLIKVQANPQGGYFSEIITKPVEVRTMVEGAKINDSLFLAGKGANLSDNMIMELADIFAYDIDFALDIRQGDQFKVVFEERFVDGAKVGNGPILAAEFINQGKKYSAIRFQDEKGKSSYYTQDGKSLKKAFIRTPVEYTRISSHFNLKRRHPVLHHIRAHKGVDYAAPTGTPIKASGDGKVDFIGKKGGYGNVVILQHGTKYSTLYAHLHRFHPKLREGRSVTQGQIIGYVGKSGLATGPHLHYEFRVNGVHHNPLTVTLPQADPLPHKTKQQFLVKAKEYAHLFELQENVMLAKNEKE